MLFFIDPSSKQVFKFIFTNIYCSNLLYLFPLKIQFSQYSPYFSERSWNIFFFCTYLWKFMPEISFLENVVNIFPDVNKTKLTKNMLYAAWSQLITRKFHCFRCDSLISNRTFALEVWVKSQYIFWFEGKFNDCDFF